MRTGIALGAGVAVGAGATALWQRSHGVQPVGEQLAGLGYTAGLVGLGAAVLAAPALLHSRTRPLARTVMGSGVAAIAGMAAGVAGTSLIAGRAPRAVLRDDQLPEPNQTKAKQIAQTVLDRVDRNAKDIVLWLPGTGIPKLSQTFVEAVRNKVGAGASLVDFPCHNDFAVLQDTADSAEALRIVLRDLDERRTPGQRILLAGESQGAWSITNVVNEPEFADVADRVALTGNPGMNEHQYDGAATDARVREFTNDGDVVAQDYHGDAQMMLDGGLRTMTGEPSNAWRIVGTAINNAPEAVPAIESAVRIAVLNDFASDPHNYDNRYPEVVEYLAGAPRPSLGG